MRAVRAWVVLTTIILAIGGVACPPPGPPKPPPDASDASLVIPPASDAAAPIDAGGEDLDAARHPACRAMCAKLAALGCPEAKGMPGGETCYATCAHAEETRKFDLRPACVADAGSVEAARACKTVRCQIP